MPRVVRFGLIQARCEWSPQKYSLVQIKQKMVAKHEKLIAQAGKKKVQVLGLQELFYGPYFCAEQNIRWYDLTERVPGGPTLERMQRLAKRYRMVLVVPVYEVEMTGVFYNTAAVIDADGRYLGKYRKHHIPHVHPGFWEKFYFTPGNTGYPVFQTKYARVGVYICYDRHFPEGARALGLNGAEIVYNPSATVAGLSEYLWELEQPAHAVANGYFVAAINRVGHERPWNIGEFYGKSYFCSPRGKIVSQASRNKDELLVADLNLEEIDQVRATWQFFRDRRPESYGDLTRTQMARSADAAN
jgi:N-carbamoylputrescine amidase